MFRTKKDLDLHARDLLSKVSSEHEKATRSLPLARAYFAMKEYQTAFRYVENYIGFNLSREIKNDDAFKLKGDILSELDKKEEAFECYKTSYQIGKNRESLTRVCDLLASGYGRNETSASRKKWLDLHSQESSMNIHSSPSNNLNGGSGEGESRLFSVRNISNSNSSLGSNTQPSKTSNAIYDLTPKSSHDSNHVIYDLTPKHNSWNKKIYNGSSSSKVNIPGNQDKEALTRLFDQNCQLIEMVKRIEDEVQELKVFGAGAGSQNSFSSPPSLNKSLADMSLSRQDDRQKYEENLSKLCEQNSTVINILTKHEESIKELKFKLDKLSLENLSKREDSISCCCSNKKTENVSITSENKIQTPNPENKSVTPKKGHDTPDTSTPIFSFGAQNQKKVELTGGTPSTNLFSSPAILSTPGFGDIAKNSVFGNTGNSGSASSSPFAFTKGFFNAGTPVFGGSSTTKENPSTERTRTTSTDEHPDDFVPNVEFEPVIPLPPLVEVKKGDENDNLIHEVRAKVLRFDAELKEWKERGVGNIKILQNKDDEFKIRIVMWREQVLKLACNHYLEKGMKVDYYNGNQKAIMWSAMDFAEQEPRKEIFVCRFGNEDHAAAFKKHMEKMINFLANKTENAKEAKNDTNPKPNNVPNSQKPLSELFKKEEGSWSCEACYCTNKKTEAVCVACQTPNPANKSAVTPKKDQQAPQATSTPTFSFGFTQKTDETSGTPTTNLFGTSSILSTPGFGELAKSSPIGSTGSSGTTGSSPFTFTKGFFNAGAPVFGGLSTTKESPSTERTRTTSTDENPDDFVPNVEFEPVIPLPPLVEVKKGDENENLIHEVRAKVLRFDAELKEWKERGVGNIKILQNKDDEFKIRIVMWREQVLKLACNHYLEKGMKVDFYNMNQKAIMWSALDFAEQEPRKEIFVCRFSNEDNAAAFKKHMEKMINLLDNKAENTNEVKNVNPKTNNMDNSQKPLSELFKKEEGSWNCDACYCPNKKDDTVCLACEAPNPANGSSVTPKKDQASPATSTPFSFGFNQKTDGSSGVTTPSSNLFSSPAILSTPGFGEIANNSLFGSTGSSGPIGGSPFKFTTGFFNAGSPVFGGLSTTKESPSTERTRTTSTDEQPDDFVPNVEFEPVIPLPPLVEVKKGDENENLIHEVRAKVLRFDAELKEWKERGVGNIKILQNKDDEFKIRIVMWREQVLKLACNHYLEKGMKVDFYNGNQKAIMWSAMDFSEQEPRKEIFVCRFGNEENALVFKIHMEKMINFLANKTENAKEAKNDTNPKPNNVPNSQKPLSELFKKEEGSWSCEACYCTNKKTEAVCVACQTPNPANKSAVTPKKDQQAPLATPFSFGFTQKTEETTGPAPLPNLFGTSTILSTPGFGELAKSSPFGSIGSSGPIGGSPFKFTTGFFNAGAPVFGGSSTSNDSPSTERTRTTSTDEHPDDFVPNVEFQPVIPLPPLVEVKKGDENENLIHEVRAKVLRFDPLLKEWKERGVGNIKILQSKDDEFKIRIVMWREQVLKLACNHYLEKGMKVDFYQGSEKAIMWTAIDFAEEGPKKEIFACKFGNEEKTKEFKNHMERMINFINGKSEGAKVEDKKSDLIAKTERLQLPPNFYDFEDEKFTPCVGCIGCDPDDFDFSQFIGRTIPDFSLEEPSESTEEFRVNYLSHAQQEDEDDDEHELMFDNEANFFIREYQFGINFTDLGPGNIKIIYDGDQFCARLMFNNLEGVTLIDHYIAAETNVTSAGDLTFEWDGVNMTLEGNMFKSRMRVVFPDQQAFDSFSAVMSDSVDLAMQAGVTEEFLLGHEDHEAQDE